MPVLGSFPLFQIALSVSSLERSVRWYSELLQLVPSERVAHHEGGIWAEVPGLPEARFGVTWLLGRRDGVQFEVFEFERPPPKPMPDDTKPTDIGYSMISLHVADLDGILARAATLGATVQVEGTSPGSRTAYLRDPDGVLLELSEAAILVARAQDPAVGVDLQGVTISVPSLADARAFWVDALGMSPVVTSHRDGPYPRPHAADRLVVDTGQCAIELVEYSSPRGRPRPPDYRISDLGILNVAIGDTDKSTFDTAYQRIISSGCRALREPWTLTDVATVVYVEDFAGISVELLQVNPSALGRMGFVRQ